MKEDYFNEDGELCPALVRKNIVLAETGGELTIPLSILNQHCEFKKKWDEIQNKWHGNSKKLAKKQYYPRPESKAKIKKYQKQYYQRPEIKAKMKQYYQRPEIKAKMKQYKKEYYQRRKQEELRLLWK
jgi:hypothetical protein